MKSIQGHAYQYDNLIAHAALVGAGLFLDLVKLLFCESSHYWKCFFALHEASVVTIFGKVN